MSNINISAILLLTDVLHARLIRKAVTEGFFSAADMSRLICFFEKDEAAQSVTYDALVQLDGTVYDGTVTIDRQGHLAVSLKHDETGHEILARFY